MMKNLLLIGTCLLIAATAKADTVTFNTLGSTLACNGVAGCLQNTPTSVTVGGITVNYANQDNSLATGPTFVQYGSIVTSGAGSANLSGLLLTININSTPPGGSGKLPNGTVNGQISTTSSTATINFSPDNTTTAFGFLPGVIIKGAGGVDEIYQVKESFNLNAPTIGTPLGATTINGFLTSTPEPSGLVLLGTGIVGLAGMVRRKVFSRS